MRNISCTCKNVLNKIDSPRAKTKSLFLKIQINSLYQGTSNFEIF